MALNINSLSKIGVGTWGLGGFQHHDSSIDKAEQVDAVAYTLKQGLNYIETTLWYSEGQAAEILASAIRKSGINREKLFISQALYDYDHKSMESLATEVEKFHKIIGTNYSDALLVNIPAFTRFGFEAVCDALENQLNQKKTRFVSVTNADNEILGKMHDRFGEHMFGHELHVDFEVRVLDDLGIVKTGENMGIKNVVAQPLRRNRTAQHNWSLLNQLAAKYSATQNQIVLAWLIQRHFLPLVKSTNKAHIDENINAMHIKLSADDMESINKWRPKITWPSIDWECTGDGVLVHQLANVFDEEYEKQNEIK